VSPFLTRFPFIVVVSISLPSNLHDWLWLLISMNNRRSRVLLKLGWGSVPQHIHGLLLHKMLLMRKRVHWLGLMLLRRKEPRWHSWILWRSAKWRWCLKPHWWRPLIRILEAIKVHHHHSRPRWTNVREVAHDGWRLGIRRKKVLVLLLMLLWDKNRLLIR